MSVEEFIIKIALYTPDRSLAVTPYDTVHICFLVGMTIASIAAFFLMKKAPLIAERVMLLSVGFLLLLMEVYKQFVISCRGVGQWTYKWTMFPFHLCAAPMYSMIIAGFMPRCRVRSAFTSFLATYTPVAGLFVMLIVDGILTTSLGVCLQGLIHHALMVVVGAVMLSREHKNFGLKNWAGGAIVFASFVAAATVLNTVIYLAMDGMAIDMFFISPFYISRGQGIITDLRNLAAAYNVGFIVPIVYTVLCASAALDLEYLIIGGRRLLRRKKISNDT